MLFRYIMGSTGERTQLLIPHASAADQLASFSFKGAKMASADPYHVRSISLPSRSHPLTVRVERGLHCLKTWAASSLLQAASPTAPELLSVGLLALEEMYDCVEELLRLPQTQRALARHHRQKGATEELESSVRLLDICGATRDAVSSLKELARGLQSGLRTRRSGLGLGVGVGDSIVRNRIRAFLESRRQAHKESSRCLKTLKQMAAAAGNVPASPLSVVADNDLSLALTALKDLKEITVVLFRSISTLFVSKQKRWFRTPRVVEEEQSSGEYLERIDAYLSSIHGGLSGKDAGSFEKKAEEAQRRLQRLEVGMGSLETGLESMFRRLIQNRVSLLNILSP